jgi:glycosyltransferase involved in cell wall biosynthesis
MHDYTPVRKRFEALNCCVIIPTYNNDQTLEMVIEDVQNFTGSIIIVNDGSTDRTGEILENWKHLIIVNQPRNKGKGLALQAGFKAALERGFRYAITIDSDGQHFPADLPKFLDAIQRDPGSLVVGARNMDQESVPGSSNFGNKFSVFWFRVETGLKIPDIQSGYRLYPLEKIRDIHFFGTKFEFELEVLVRSAWKSIPILAIPVFVYYAPKEDRVSHFRKFRDSLRFTATNLILVFVALLWKRPWLLFKELRQKSLKQFIKEYVIDSKDSNARLSWSVAAGLFIGVTPIWGWQMMVAFGLAHLLKLNKFVTVAAANISIPPLIPLILFLSYFTGGIVLGNGTSHNGYNPGLSLEWLKDNLLQYVLGSVVFGIVLAVLLGLASYILLGIFRKKKPETLHPVN